MLLRSNLVLHAFPILVLLYAFNQIHSRPINAATPKPLFYNGIVGEPILVCGANHISFKFVTKDRFLGRVFLKGMSSPYLAKKNHERDGRKSCEIRAKEACLVGLKSAKNSSAGMNTTINAAFANSSQFCSMRIPFDGDYQGCPSLHRRRIISPTIRGMQISATLVVSFHPHFITQMDKMYRLQCFYTSANSKNKDERGEEQPVIDGRTKGSTMSKVKTAFRVQSANSSQERNDAFSNSAFTHMPVCKYEILENNAEGPLANLSPVQPKRSQQLLYHKWSCELGATEKPEASAFCFRVHSCLAQSPSIKQLIILDREGCSLDKFLLNNLEYGVEEGHGKRKLVAGQFSQIHKYRDAESLYLQCQIKLWKLAVGEWICPDYNQYCPEPKDFGGFHQVLEKEQVIRTKRFLGHKERRNVEAGVNLNLRQRT